MEVPTARVKNTRERLPPDKPENRSLAPNTADSHTSSALESKWTTPHACLSAQRYEKSCYRHVTRLKDRKQTNKQKRKDDWAGCRTGTGALAYGGQNRVCLCVCRQRSYGPACAWRGDTGLVLGVCGALVAVLSDHVLCAPMRLQRLYRRHVLRKLGLASHQGPFLPLVSEDLHKIIFIRKTESH